jgi:hypothetical protein
MGRLFRISTFAFAVALIALCATTAGAQTIKYAVGQDIGPVFEGFERNADGSYNFVFGYLNRNFEEEIDIPVGPNNYFDQGPQDRGQPTHFYPRRQRFLFRVSVPKDWDKTRKLVWTVTAHGKTNQAKGWLEPTWELSPEVISENINGGVLEEGNEPPVINGSSAETVTLPTSTKLTVTVTDDGIPKLKPRKKDSAAAPDAAANPDLDNPDAPIRRTEGVQVRWIHYRGPGKVTLNPSDSGKAVYGKPVTLTTTATFSAPGTYILRAIATDGQRETQHDVTVTVKGASQ